MSELPRPITNDQEYLAAILDELRGISAKLDILVVQTQPVELVEPCIVISEPASVPSGELVQAVVEEEVRRETKARRARKV